MLSHTIFLWLCGYLAMGKPTLTGLNSRSSDADSDVLADYVLALIRADTPEPELRANAIENLEDFLKERMLRSPSWYVPESLELTTAHRHKCLC